MRVLWSVVLAVGVLGACSRGDEAANGAPGSGCTGRTASCASTSHGVCVEVQMSQGHCVDWSAAGATPCAGDPADCPSSAPSTTFPLGEAASTSVACIAADGTMQF